ncbi:MAG: dephospho-CoA kinase [Congregibacter sp.]
MTQASTQPLRVGLTGGIGSGKTAVSNLLADQGVTIVDADVVAREVVEPGSEALLAIAAHFGQTVIAADGSLNRSALREIVFATPDERRWLESLTHPLIRERIAKQLQAVQAAYVVLSSPLLLEGRQADFVEHVVVVDVPESLQISRTAHRDGNSETLVRSIMQAQMPRDERLKRADTVLDNSGSLEELEPQVTQLHTKLLSLSAARAKG